MEGGSNGEREEGGLEGGRNGEREKVMERGRKEWRGRGSGGRK